MKVLVTGAKGFVGGYIVEKLLENNFSVIGLQSKVKVPQASWTKNSVEVSSIAGPPQRAQRAGRAGRCLVGHGPACR